MKTIGQRIAYFREQKGMGQGQLSAACGWGDSNSRISNYEKGVREPKLGDIKILAKALGVSFSQLADDEASGVLEETTSPARLKPVPVVGTAQLGNDGYWSDLGYPAGHGDGFVDYASSDPDAYSVRFNGNSMAPRFRHGEFGIIEPNTPVSGGDEVLVKTTDGRSMVKVFAYEKNGQVHLQSVNDGQFSPIILDKGEIEFMHYVPGSAKRRRVHTKPAQCGLFLA